MIVCASPRDCQGSTDLVKPCDFFVNSCGNRLWCERVMGKSSLFKGEMGPTAVDSCLKERVHKSFKKNVKKIVVQG